MKPVTDKISRILSEWKGSDAGRQADPKAVAQAIDEVYQEYLASLPRQTAAIRAGQAAQERHVA